MARSTLIPWNDGDGLGADDKNAELNHLLVYLKQDKDEIRGDNAEGTGVAGHDHEGTYGIVLGTDALEDGAVETAKIEDNAITNAKLDNDAVQKENVNGLTATIAEINTIADGVVATAAQVNSVAADGKYDSKGMILGDTTAGRVLRCSELAIADGTNPNTIKATLFNVWNGDVVSIEDNLSKGASTASFELGSGGGTFYIKTGVFTGTLLVVLVAYLSNNESGTNLVVQSDESSGKVYLRFEDISGTEFDLTTITTDINVRILYLVY